MAHLAQPRFLDEPTARSIADQFGSPVYVYDQATLQANASAVLNFPNAYGLTARYAMKAAPSAAMQHGQHDSPAWGKSGAFGTQSCFRCFHYFRF